MPKQNVQYIDTAISALNSNQAVDVTQWSDHKVEQVLRQMPHTNMNDVAAFGVEMACRHANRYVLDIFLPHSDPTALDYYLVRHAVHRYIDSKNKEESLALLQDVVRRADDIHVQSGRAPVSDDIDVIENLKPSVRSVLFSTTQPLRFNRDLEQQAFGAHHSQLKAQRKM